MRNASRAFAYSDALLPSQLRTRSLYSSRCGAGVNTSTQATACCKQSLKLPRRSRPLPLVPGNGEHPRRRAQNPQARCHFGQPAARPISISCRDCSLEPRQPGVQVGPLGIKTSPNQRSKRLIPFLAQAGGHPWFQHTDRRSRIRHVE